LGTLAFLFSWRSLNWIKSSPKECTSSDAPNNQTLRHN
jgi:hypothetical protein